MHVTYDIWNEWFMYNITMGMGSAILQLPPRHGRGTVHKWLYTDDGDWMTGALEAAP